MENQLLKHHLKSLGFTIEDKTQTTLNGVGFDFFTTNTKGDKYYFTVVEQKESNDIYSPKGDINKKIDSITRLMRRNDSKTHFSIAVPNTARYKKILNQKLSMVTERLDVYFVGDDVEVLST